MSELSSEDCYSEVMNQLDEVSSERKPSNSKADNKEELKDPDSEKTSEEIEQQYNMDDSTEDEASNPSRSRGSSADSTPIKHLEPPTPTPASHKTKKTPRGVEGGTRSRGGGNRFPSRAGMVWRVGAKLEAKDFQEKWYTAKIVEVDGSDNTILVHFEGWNSRYDDWFPMNSERLRCVTRHSERKETRSKTVQKAEHKIGECVFAKWTDCRMYPGKIMGVSSSGSYEVLFYDGFKKNVVPINVKTMPEEVQQEYAKAGLLPEVGKKNKFPIKDFAKEIQDKREQKVKSPETNKRQKNDSDRKSTEKKVKDTGKEQEVKMSASTTGEKRKRSLDSSSQGPVKKQKTAAGATTTSAADAAAVEAKSEQQPRAEKGRRESAGGATDGRTRRESTRSRTVKADRSSPVGRRSERSTPKSTPKTPLASPLDTLTTELPTEEYHCPHTSCKKTFRKKSLVDCHVKYYHNEDGTPIQPPRGKRRKTLSICSDDSEVSQTATRGSRGKRKRDRTSLESLTSTVQEVCNEDAMSEDTKTTTTEEYQQDLLQTEDEYITRAVRRASTGVSIHDDELDEEGVESREKMERIEKDEVVNCICQINEENGLMIQCDVCLCWQHAVCMELTEDTLPTKYVCYVCLNPPGVRESGRFIYDQDWIRLGTMHRFGFLSEDRHSAKKARIMEATHSLVGDLLNVKSVLHATKTKLSVVRDESSPELKLWQKQLDPAAEPIADLLGNDITTANKPEDGTKKDNQNCSSRKQSLSDTGVSMEKSNGNSHHGNIGAVEDTNSNEGTSSDGKQSGIKQENVSIKDGVVKAETDSSEVFKDRNIKTEAGSMNGEVGLENCMERDGKRNRDEIEDEDRGSEKVKDEGQRVATATCGTEEEQTDVKVKVEEENPFEKCSLNLLQHVGCVHKNASQRLDLLEEQIAALEAAEESRNVDILKDLPKVKKSLHHLISDLGKVKRMAMYH